MNKSKAELAVRYYRNQNIPAYLHVEGDWKNHVEKVFITVGDLNIEVSEDEIELRAKMMTVLGSQNK